VRIAFLRIHQKTNSFSKFPTTIDDFARSGILYRDQFTQKFQQTDTLSGHLLTLSESSDHTVDLIVSMEARTGGPVVQETLESIFTRIDECSDELRAADGVIVELSGTMLDINGCSVDARILEHVKHHHGARIVVAVLDHQASIPGEFTSTCDGLILRGPLGDESECKIAHRAIRLLEALTSETEEVTTCIEKIPLLIPVAAQRAEIDPFPSILSMRDEMISECQLLDLSIASGYPFTDAEFAGATIVATGSPKDVKTAAARLASALWDRRQEIYVSGSNIEEAVHFGMASKERPVLITDLGDNPDDGAPGDGTTVLWALLDLGVRSATVAPICDEQAVDACVRAGVGGKVSIPVGGRKDTRHGYPIDVEGRVVAIHDGTYRLTGPVRTGLEMNPGTIVVLEIDARHDGHVELVLTQHPVQITDLSFFEHCGIDIREREIVSIKSAGEYRAAFEPIAESIFEVISPGITTPDPAFFAYQQVRRPIYPLDDMTE
jgi:microcystin degradation protein MlrC